MKIDCISDLHGFLPPLPGGDLLILAGDYTARVEIKQWAEFFSWMKKQNYRKKILIAGNHDNFLEKAFPKTQKEADELKEIDEWLTELRESDFEYLCDSRTEFEGLKIWGTPWSLLFPEANPKCITFMGTEEQLEEKYEMIPNDIDILISHSPPYGILDKSIRGVHCGSIALRNAMMKVKPRYLVCGHIHECGSKEVDLVTTKVINCSYVNERYKPVHSHIRIEL